MDINYDLEVMRDNNFKTKIQNELNYLKDGSKSVSIFSNMSNFDLDDRIMTLEKLLNIKSEFKKSETSQQKKENIIAEIEKYTYRKQWNKLTSFHKIVKLKEFVKDNFDEGELQNEIVDKLAKYAEEGRINTKKYVVYDPNTEKILSMPCLTVDINKKTYQIKIV
jgi:hypothetical protein